MFANIQAHPFQIVCFELSDLVGNLPVVPASVAILEPEKLFPKYVVVHQFFLSPAA